MATKARDGPPEVRRLNRTVGIGEALGPVLGPALRKRGFAGRDIISHWAAIAPAPYDTVTLPDKLVWPRGAGRIVEGATLYLRCLPGHALALAHEGQRIAAAVNRYFGYFLVRDVRLSIEPLQLAVPSVPEPQPDPVAIARVERTVGRVEDEGLRDALKRLGEGILGKG